MKHLLSADDGRFRRDFETCGIAPADFDHRGHLRLAYTYLVEHDVDTATELMRVALLNFLQHNEVPASKYHETMTRAWIMAVKHFMESSAPASSADAFIDANPTMLDSRIMMTHYSAALLFSDEARARFVQPDLDPIPRYQAPGSATSPRSVPTRGRPGS